MSEKTEKKACPFKSFQDIDSITYCVEEKCIAYDSYFKKKPCRIVNSLENISYMIRQIQKEYKRKE